MKAWKVQKIFGDIVYDLRSRGLLPVVILLVVAMVAVPMLLAGGGTSSTGASLQPTAGTSAVAPEAENAVVSYNPGVRDYKKRLNDLSAKDPFHQQFNHAASTASALSSTVSVPTGSAAVVPSTVSGGSSKTISKGGPKKTGGSKNTQPVSVTYQANLLAGDASGTLTPFNNVSSMTALPSQTTPVVIFWGLTPDFKNALFLVSNKVSIVNGPGTCVPAPDDCALLSLSAGQSEDLLYTGDGKTYRVVVAEIKRVTG